MVEARRFRTGKAGVQCELPAPRPKAVQLGCEARLTGQLLHAGKLQAYLSFASSRGEAAAAGHSTVKLPLFSLLLHRQSSSFNFLLPTASIHRESTSLTRENTILA